MGGQKYDTAVAEAPVQSKKVVSIHASHRMNLYSMLMDMLRDMGAQSISKEEGEMLLDLHQSLSEVLPLSKN